MIFDKTKSMYEIVAETVWNHERRFRSAPSVLHFLGVDFETPGMLSKLDTKKMPGSDQFRQGLKYPPYWAGVQTASVEPIASNLGTIKSKLAGETSMSLLLNPRVPITQKVMDEVIKKHGVTLGALNVPGGGVSSQFSAISPSNKVLFKDIPEYEKSTGQRIFYTEKEFTGMLNPYLKPKQGRTIMFGHNLKFDMMHLRAMEGFEGVHNVSVLDSLTMFPAMFPELNLPSTGARKLDTIYELLTADPKVLRDTYKINHVPQELAIAFQAYQDSGMLPVGASMHSPLKDINVSRLIIDAAIRMRGQTAYGKNLLSSFLAKEGIIQGYVADMMQAMNLQDPARLAGFMRQGKPKAGVTMLQGHAGLVFRGKKGIPALVKKIQSIYGSDFAGGQFEKFAQYMAENVGGDLTFVLQGNEAAGTMTNLSVGRWGDPTTFRAMPLQSRQPLERGLLFRGDKTYTVDRIGFLNKKGIQYSDVAEEFYKNLNFELRRHRLTNSRNIEASLRIATKRAWQHPIHISGKKQFPLQGLLGASPYESGLLNLERASHRGNLLTLGRKTKFLRRTKKYVAAGAGAEHPLMQAITELGEARSAFNKIQGSYSAPGGEDIVTALQSARSRIKEAESRVFSGLQSLGMTETELGKADYILKAEKGQPIRIADPGAGEFYGLTPTERTRTKGRHQIRTGGDLTQAQRARLVQLGVKDLPQIMTTSQFMAAADAHGPLSKRLQALGQGIMDNTIMSKVLVAEFATELGSLHAIGDSAARATAMGMKKLGHHIPLGDIIIKNATSSHLRAIGDLFDHPSVRQTLENLNPGGLRLSPQAAAPMRGLRGAAKSAYKYLIHTLPGEESNLLREAAASGRKGRGRLFGLTGIQFRGADIHLSFNRRRPAVPTSVGIIAGEGPARMTVTGVFNAKLNAALEAQGIDFMMRHQDFKSLGIVDTLLTHQTSLVWKHVQDTVGTSQAEAVKLWTDYLQAIGAKGHFRKGLKTTRPIVMVTDRLAALRASEAFFEANQAGRLQKIAGMHRGMELDIDTLSTLKSELGASGIPLGGTAKAFYVGVKIRADQYLDANLKNASTLSFRNIAMIGQGSGALGYQNRFENPLFNFLNRILGEQTGFKFGAQGLEVPHDYRRFAEPLAGKMGPIPSGATVVRVKNGRFVTQSGQELANAPAATIRGKGVGRELYEGTIWDPSLRARGLYVDLAGEHQIPIGKEGKHLKAGLINIPGEELLPIVQGNRVVVGSDSPSGRFMSAIEGLRLGGMDESVINRVGGKVSPARALGESISEMMTGWTGGTGGMIQRGTLQGKGFAARIVPRRSMVGTSAQTVFEAQMTIDDLDNVIRRTFGRGQAARELRSKIRTSGFHFPMIFRRNPPNRPESMSLLRIVPVEGKRLIRNARKGRAKGVIERFAGFFRDIGVFSNKPSIAIDPLLAEMMRADHDLDVGTALEVFTRATPEELGGLEEVYQRQISAIGPEVNRFLSLKGSASPDTLASLIDDAISGGAAAPSPEFFSALLGQKAEAPTAFMIRRRTHETAKDAISQGEKSAPQFFRKLIGEQAATRDLGSPVTSFYDRLRAIGKGRHSPSAVHQAFSTLFENPIQSTILKGSAKDIIHRIGETWAAAAQPGAPDSVGALRGVFTEFASLAVDQPKIGVLGTASSMIHDLYGSASPQAVGEFMGDVAAASIDLYKGVGSRVRSLESMAESTGVGEEGLNYIFRNLLGHGGLLDPDVPNAPTKQAILQGVQQGQKFNKAAMLDAFKNTIKTKPGLVAIGIAGIVGAYGLFRGMTGGSMDNPPALPVPLQGSPLPPPPALAQPTDRSSPRIPAARNVRLARVGMAHPAPIPRRGLSKNYHVADFGSSSGYANSIGVDINNDSKGISNHEIAARMKEVANSDYAY